MPTCPVIAGPVTIINDCCIRVTALLGCLMLEFCSTLPTKCTPKILNYTILQAGLILYNYYNYIIFLTAVLE